MKFSNTEIYNYDIRVKYILSIGLVIVGLVIISITGQSYNLNPPYTPILCSILILLAIILFVYTFIANRKDKDSELTTLETTIQNKSSMRRSKSFTIDYYLKFANVPSLFGTRVTKEIFDNVNIGDKVRLSRYSFTKSLESLEILK